MSYDFASWPLPRPASPICQDKTTKTLTISISEIGPMLLTCILISTWRGGPERKGMTMGFHCGICQFHLLWLSWPFCLLLVLFSFFIFPSNRISSESQVVRVVCEESHNLAIIRKVIKNLASLSYFQLDCFSWLLLYAFTLSAVPPRSGRRLLS